MSKAAKRRSGESVSNPAGYLATQDLKERGWTVRLIADFLGEHDLTRPNGLKMGRRKLPPVKLYLESRVEAVENDEDFLVLFQRAQERRERVQQHREAKALARAERLQDWLERFQPALSPQPIRKGAVRQARAPYLPALEQLLEAATAEIGLTAGEQKELRRLLTLRLDELLRGVYDWFPAPKQQGPAAHKARTTGEAQPANWQAWDWD